MPKTIDLIVHADDLGYSQSVNEAVFDLMGKGLVTSASLLANAPAVEAACNTATNFPKCSFGVHLNVTEFHPLKNTPGIFPLLDENGEFIKGRVNRFSISKQLKQAIFEEYCLQIEKLYSLGVNITHINSHHYVHSQPGMFGVLKKLQRHFDLRTVRISRNIYGPEETAGFRVHFLKGVYNFLLKHYYRSQTTSYFTDFATFYMMAQSRLLKQRSIEVHVHPGAGAYSDETRLLESDWREKLKFPVRLINHQELK